MDVTLRIGVLLQFFIMTGSQSSEASRESSSTSTLSTTTIMASPVELTHLFLNKDGTLDSSRLFRTQNREELSLMDPSLAPGDSDRLLSATDSVFLSKNNTNFSAHSGSTVILPCSVQKESKFEMIMWARQLQGANASYQILTIGDSTHINDNRFLITKSDANNDWSLRILRVDPSDSGAYKCQANSHPPQFITTYLSVHVAYAEIDGQREKFIKDGSALVLNCTFRLSTEPPAYVFWYHNSRMISYDRGRGQTVDINANYSTLRLPQVTGPYDSGNYTCAPHNMSPDAVVVHILGGFNGVKGEAAEETAAAAVHDNEEKTEDIFMLHSGGLGAVVGSVEIVTIIYLLLFVIVTK